MSAPWSIDRCWRRLSLAAMDGMESGCWDGRGTDGVFDVPSDGRPEDLILLLEGWTRFHAGTLPRRSVVVE